MQKTGFGFLRLPRLDPEDPKRVDYPALNALVDRFIALGGDYFDTCYTYLDGVSEEAIRRAVVERYPREQYRLANKLPGYDCLDRCEEYLQESLRRCGVEWFDVYMIHSMGAENYHTALQYGQLDFLRGVKERGLARAIGFSFHDSPDVLDRILTEQPGMDYVLLQINYLDWRSPSLQAEACYETAVRHGVKVIVMEPVKGGQLANPPEEAARLLRRLRPQDSPSRWGIRFATDLPQVEIVLSGMNGMEQVEENLLPHEPLTQQERRALAQAAETIRAKTAVACTGCGYCRCSLGLPIPRYFALYNDLMRYPGDGWKIFPIYQELAGKYGPASACVGCRKCLSRCPQKLDIPRLMQEAGVRLDALHGE